MAYGPTLKNTSNRTSRLKWLLVAVVMLVVLGVGGFFGYRWYMDSKAQDPVSEQNQQESTQDDTVSVRDDQTDASTSTTPSTSPPSSVPIQEQQVATGIVISSPKTDSTVTNGTKLEGTAPTNYASVSYRIQSDERGMVGQGELKIVNGKFSGTIGSGGATGAGLIEVFVIDANGREQKHTKVAVRFGG